MGKRSFGVSTNAVCFVQKEDYGDILFFQCGKEQFRLRLHALHRAYNKHSQIQSPNGTLNLRGEVCMSRSINQVNLGAVVGKTHARGFDGNSPPAFNGQRIGMGGAGIHASGITNRSGMGEESFG